MASMRKMLEHRNITDEERMDQLEANLKEAKLMAEDADRKYDEVELESDWSENTNSSCCVVSKLLTQSVPQSWDRWSPSQR